MDQNRKIVFVVENNKLERNLIKDYFKENSLYEFKYFSSSTDCLAALNQHPMAVLIDFDLKTINPNENDAITILDKIKKLEHNTEVVFYSHHDSVEVAIATIKHGAFDYIVVNDNQFLRLENELSAISDFRFHKTESNKYKKMFWFVIVFSIVWIILILILVFTGVLKAGNGVWVEA